MIKINLKKNRWSRKGLKRFPILLNTVKARYLTRYWLKKAYRHSPWKVVPQTKKYRALRKKFIELVGVENSQVVMSLCDTPWVPKALNLDIPYDKEEEAHVLGPALAKLDPFVSRGVQVHDNLLDVGSFLRPVTHATLDEATAVFYYIKINKLLMFGGWRWTHHPRPVEGVLRIKTVRPAVQLKTIRSGLQLKRGGPVVQPKKNIMLKKKFLYKYNPFSWLSVSLLIRDLEHYLGGSINLVIERRGSYKEDFLFYTLRYCFFIQFAWVDRYFFAPLHEAFLSLYYGGVCHDLDLICKFYQEVLVDSYYADAPKLFKVFSHFLCYMWPMYIRRGLGVGLFFELKGKFHRYMTIESVSKKLRLGKTTRSTVDFGLTFRYRQGVNETGAFGIHLMLLSKNELCVMYKLAI